MPRRTPILRESRVAGYGAISDVLFGVTREHTAMLGPDFAGGTDSALVLRMTWRTSVTCLQEGSRDPVAAARDVFLRPVPACS